MDAWFEFLVDALAVHRVVRFVTADDLPAETRDGLVRWSYLRAGRLSKARGEMRQAGCDPALPGQWAEWAQRDPAPPKLATLVTCRWCASIWAAAAVVAARRVAPRLWRPVAAGLALSSASTLAAALEKD